MKSQTSLNIARMVFVLLCIFAGMAVAFSTSDSPRPLPMSSGTVGGLVLAAFILFVERLMKGFTLRGFSTATFGLLVGLFCAWLLTKVQLHRLLIEALSLDNPQAQSMELAVNTALFASLGFIGTALALRTGQEDFAFVVPYIHFRRERTIGQPLITDAETLIDGRIPALLSSKFLRGRLIVPLFTLEELQVMANSPSGTRKGNARRALAQIERLQESTDFEVTVHDTALTTSGAEESPDALLIEAARNLAARLLTIDPNLAKAARLRGAEALDINELSEALKPSIVIGQRLRLPLVRPGKDDHQAVGYLPDGTMIVVNHAVSQMGTTQDVIVISTIQTTAGQMVFAELYAAHQEDVA